MDITNADSFMWGIFTWGRVPPFPTLYSENKTAVTVDVLEIGWITAFITGYLCFMILLPAAVGSEKAFYFIKITLFAFIGLTTVLCNFGQEWEVGQIESQMFYKAGSHQEIDGHITVKLGLRSVNITLYADPASLHGDLIGEKINYNERFTWAWEQGRAGFGPFAGRIQQEFREAQLKGVPYPILWVAEYFTFDGEGLRFGRHYRQAGWYAHICVWCSFVCWILSLILFKVFILYGAVMLSILGCFLVIAALIWCSIRNFVELAIVFNNEPTGVLKTHFGIHWYLALLVGIFCMVCGIIIALLDAHFHNAFCKFFGVDPYAIIDEDYDTDVKVERPSNNIMMEEASTFGRKKRNTVVYRARGSKKHWTNNADYQYSIETDKLQPTPAPKINPEYLDMSRESTDDVYVDYVNKSEKEKRLHDFSEEQAAYTNVTEDTDEEDFYQEHI